MSPSLQQIEHGSDATVSITADPGYDVVSITDNGVSQDITDYYEISNVTSAHNVIVTFAIRVYAVNASVAGDVGGTVSPASRQVDHGSTATIDIDAASGYFIKYITDNGVTQAVSDSYVIENVTMAHEVVVTFAREYTWVVQDGSTANNLYGVSALDSSHIWAVGAMATIRCFDGSTWATQPSGEIHDIYTVSASGADNVWTVGEDGCILVFNGTSWCPKMPEIECYPEDVFTLDENHVWVVGNQGAIYFFDGLSWTAQPSGTSNSLLDVFALDAAHVWAVGSPGYDILFYNGTTWSTQTCEATDTLRSVFALDATHVWAVGSSGNILFFDGTTWTAQDSGTTNALFGVFSVDADHVWAVGDAGTILFFDGTTWTAQDSGTTNALKVYQPLTKPISMQWETTAQFFSEVMSHAP